MNKMLGNKASIKQVFTFLLIAILIGLIFLFAIKVIPDLLNSACDANFVLFVKDINSYLDKYSTFGSINLQSLIIPCDYTEICFVDAEALGKEADYLELYNDQSINLMIRESVIAGIEYNVFLVKGEIATPITYSQKLRVIDADYICIPNIGGKAKIKFVGQGRTTGITV